MSKRILLAYFVLAAITAPAESFNLDLPISKEAREILDVEDSSAPSDFLVDRVPLTDTIPAHDYSDLEKRKRSELLENLEHYIDSTPKKPPRPVAPPSGLDFETLAKRLEAKDSKIKSVEDLVCDLQSDYLSNYSAMYDSRSLQRSTPSQPRMLLYGATAKLVLAYGGSSVHSRAHAVEAMVFDDKTSQFSFHEIDFPEGGGKPVIRRNPPECLHCHGNPPAPLWDPYSLWPGAYGTSDDHYTEFPKSLEFRQTREGIQRDAFERLRKQQKENGHGIYRCLNDLDYAYRELGEQAVRPNLMLNLLLDPLEKKFLAHLIEKDHDLTPLKYAMAASLMSCDLAPFFPSVSSPKLSSVLKTIQSDIQHVDETAIRAKYDRYEHVFDQPLTESTVREGEHQFEYSLPPVTGMRFLVDGFSSHHLWQWAMNATSPSYDFGNTEGIEDLRKYLLPGGDKTCDDLLAEHKKTFPDTTSNRSRVTNAIERLTARKTRDEINPFRRCVQCHLPGNESNAPVLPFEHPGALGMQIRSNPAIRAKIRDRLSLKPRTGAAMPPNGPLSEVEREAIDIWMR